ncbi:MAG TPA: hypothetical protein VGI95_05850 [Caulobacteraceae bacterium]|jgi:hypothetical protein
MGSPAEYIDIGDGRWVGVEVLADDADQLVLAVLHYQSAEGGLRPVPGSGVIMPIDAAEQLVGAVLGVVEKVERAEAGGRLRHNP